MCRPTVFKITIFLLNKSEINLTFNNKILKARRLPAQVFNISRKLLFEPVYPANLVKKKRNGNGSLSKKGD